MTAKQTKKNAPADAIPALISNSKLQKMYETMLQCRILDAHARKFRSGRPGSKGKEAAIIGAVIDLLPEDRIVTAAGAAAIRYVKGARLETIFSDLHAAEDKKATVPPSADFSTQASIAAGFALAERERSDTGVTVAFLSGNGAPSANWQAGLLFAAAKKLPVLAVCDAKDIDESLIGSLPLPAIPVDGNDVVAVYRVAFECLQRIRRNGGPSLIVCKDVPPIAGGVRALDPLRAMEMYLAGKNLFAKDRRRQVIESFEKSIEKAAAAARKGHIRKSPHKAAGDVISLSSSLIAK